MHETVYTSNTHRPIQLRSSSKQQNLWWTTRNLFKILCNCRRHDNSYSFLLRTLVVYKDLVMDPHRVLLFYSFSCTAWACRSCKPRCMACVALCITAHQPSLYLYTLIFLLFNILLSLTSKKRVGISYLPQFW